MFFTDEDVDSLASDSEDEDDEKEVITRSSAKAKEHAEAAEDQSNTAATVKVCGAIPFFFAQSST